MSSSLAKRFSRGGLLAFGVVSFAGFANAGCSSSKHDQDVFGCLDSYCGGARGGVFHGAGDAGADGGDAGDGGADAVVDTGPVPTTFNLNLTVQVETKIEFTSGGVAPGPGYAVNVGATSAACDPASGTATFVNVTATPPLTYFDVQQTPNLLTKFADDSLIAGGTYTRVVPVVAAPDFDAEAEALGVTGIVHMTATLIVTLNGPSAVGATATPAATAPAIGPVYDNSTGNLDNSSTKVQVQRFGYFGLDPSKAITVNVTSGTLHATVTPPLAAGVVTWVQLTPR